MKKLLACGLILSTLMSFGSVCFAAGKDEEDLQCDVMQLSGFSATIKRDSSFEFKYKSRVPNFKINNFEVYQDDSSCVLFLMHNNTLYDITNSAGGLGYFSLMGYKHRVSFDYDTKDRNVVCCEEYMNIGDGVWHKTSAYEDPKNGQACWSVETVIQSKCQYKYLIEFEDGDIGEVKFFGSELLESDKGELDMGILCLKNIFLLPQNDTSRNSHIKLEVKHIDEDEDDDSDDYDSTNSTECPNCEETKKPPRKPRGDNEERKPITLKDRKKFKDLTQQAIALLSGYYDLDERLIWYTYSEMERMTLEDFNEACDVLTLDGVIKKLPTVVSETLRGYLKLRSELFPDTMESWQPLFITSGHGGRKSDIFPIRAISMDEYDRQGREQLKEIRPDLIFTDSKELKSIITSASDNAIADLFKYCRKKGMWTTHLAEALSDMKISDFDLFCKTLTVAGKTIECSKRVEDSLLSYLRLREDLLPETIAGNFPLFIDCRQPKQALPTDQSYILHVYMINMEE